MADTVATIPAAVLSDDGASSTSRRSSSQASRTSTDSTKDKPIRRPKRQVSRPTISRTHTRDPSLTSFPSFVEENGAANIPHPPVTTQKPIRTVSQKVRDRRETLAGLTNTSPGLSPRQDALFDDSPRPSIDIPGSLHLASDDHIERLIVRKGATKLVRQYAADLAQRDAEISTLRARADLRERELKRMLREADVPSAEVEKRLMRVERPAMSTSKPTVGGLALTQQSATSLDGMMTEAMTAGLSPQALDGAQAAAATIDPSSRKQSLAQTTLKRINSASVEASRGSVASSRQPSRTSSIVSLPSPDGDATLRPTNSNATARLTGLQSIFQPQPGAGYFIGGSTKPVKKTKATDEISVRSNHSTKSSSSWMRIFGVGTQTGRSRALSLEPESGRQTTHNDAAAALGKVRTSSATQLPKSGVAGGSMRNRPVMNRKLTGGRSSSSPHHVRKESNASSLPPTVELDSMIESSQLPPTMTDHNPEGLLTDRYGFIYDRKRKRTYLQTTRHHKQKSLSKLTLNSKTNDTVLDGDHIHRPSTPASIEEVPQKQSWQDYLTPSSTSGRGRPRELLSHTPSAGAVVTVNAAADNTGTNTPPRVSDGAISVSSQKAAATLSSISTAPTSTTSTIAAAGPDQDNDTNELAATKALLDQLTEVHDALQTERTVKWNDFLRKVRAERAVSADRSVNNAPEADLVDGELIGIATLGRTNKTKNKYAHFKSLVLAGIPVALRPKIWAECSGATQMRIPGYYDDLVTRSQEGSDIDADTIQQIKADVKRTLRDNIFFRDPAGAGAQHLDELLRAYALHNPKIGYCQGMNLITASLLLICATPEDCFWLLVAMIDHILPSGYFDHSLLVARADQIVLRQYVAEVLPKLDAKLQELGVELEACTFHWFLSLYSGVLTGGEALYRIWDVVFCLNSSDATPNHQAGDSQSRTLNIDMPSLILHSPIVPQAPTFPSSDANISTSTSSSTPQPADGAHDGTSSPFLFQLSLALLKLNESAIVALDSPATIYTYLNHNMTAHNITIDALVAASEALRAKVKKTDVLERRKAAVQSLM